MVALISVPAAPRDSFKEMGAACCRSSAASTSRFDGLAMNDTHFLAQSWYLGSTAPSEFCRWLMGQERGAFVVYLVSKEEMMKE